MRESSNARPQNFEETPLYAYINGQMGQVELIEVNKAKTSYGVAERDAVKRWFEVNGKSVSDWAVSHGFKREQVYAVLNGRTAGRRGTAHLIAVELGLKKPTDNLPPPPDRGA